MESCTMAKKEKAGHRQRLRERFLAGEAGSVYVIFRPAALPDKAKVTGEVGTKLGLSKDQVQGPSPQTPDRRWAHLDDHPGQAAEQQAEVSAHRQRVGGGSKFKV